MISARPELVSLLLKPGELVVSREPCAITTVLGSCVAVTMFSSRLGLAAMCHAMLPNPKSRETLGESDPERFRYVACAIPLMVGVFRRAGARPGEIDVKMFGGANVIGPRPLRNQEGIGYANIRLARALLRQANLQISASNVGGLLGRKILFNTLTGQVLHKHLSK